MCSTRQIDSQPRIIFLFVDGLGYREPAPDNPVNTRHAPTLFNLLQTEAVPLDACLGVPGLPQSATGQATLFTGINQARAIGHHVAGFPGPQLRKSLQQNNLFLALDQRGLSCKFANAYGVSTSVAEVIRGRRKSVTTVMALTLPASVSLKNNLLSGMAVSEDITRRSWIAMGMDLPPVTREQAATHLAALSRHHSFVLFEYFRTDRAGHKLDPASTAAILEDLDRFLQRLLIELRNTQTMLILTSDHGNLEDSSHDRHTRNPVPLVAIGPDADLFKKGAKSITDVFHLVLHWFER